MRVQIICHSLLIIAMPILSTEKQIGIYSIFVLFQHERNDYLVRVRTYAHVRTLCIYVHVYRVTFVKVEIFKLSVWNTYIRIYVPRSIR